MVAAVQLPLASPPATPVLLDPKLFRPGTLLEALVVGKTAEGLVQLQIGDFLVAAKLPQMLPPGTTLQLAVKTGGAVPELVVAPTSVQQLTPQVQPQPLPPVISAMPPTRSASAPLQAPVLEPGFATVGTVSSQPSAVVATTTVFSPATTAQGLAPISTMRTSSALPASQPPAAQVPAQSSNATTIPAPVGFLSEPRVAASAVPQATIASPDASIPAGAGRGPLVAVPSPSVPVTSSTAALPLVTTREAPVLPTRSVEPAPIALRPGVSGITNPAPPLPQSPQAALAQMVPAALSQQGSPAPLLQALSAVVASAIPVPAPVLRAAQQVLAARVPMAALNADVLKSAVEGSGVMLEAVLAKGAAPSIGDAKVGLLVLRAALTSWLGDLAPVEPVRRVPPPIKGETLRAQITEPLSDLPASARDVGRVLHGHAEAALSRLKLMQLASLPDSDANRQSGPELRLELPLMVGSELAMAQLQIFRDGKRNREAARRGWTVRFAVATAATGEVGAEIGLTGRTINVALWAAEEVTAIAMARTLPELDERLGRLGLTSTIRMRAGPPRGSRTPPGQFVDRGS